MAHYSKEHNCSTCAGGQSIGYKVEVLRNSLAYGKEIREELLSAFADVPKTFVLCCLEPSAGMTDEGRPALMFFPPVHWCTKHQTMEEYEAAQLLRAV